MTMKKPVLDLFLISYNKAQWLREGIECALKQGDSVRVWVIDNDSSDESVRICKEYPVNLIALDENTGMIGAIKIGIGRAEEYVMTISSEDPLVPGIIPKMMRLFEDGKTEVVGCHYRVITVDEKFLTWYPCSFGPELFLYCSMSGHFIAKKSVYEKIMWNDFIVDGINAYNDWAMWIDAMKKGVRVRILPEIGFTYREHPSMTNEADRIKPKFKKRLRDLIDPNPVMLWLKFIGYFFVYWRSIIVLPKRIIIHYWRKLRWALGLGGCRA